MFVPHMHIHLPITTRLPYAAKCLTHPSDVRYRTLGRSAEARDAMTAALSMPMWTLGDVDLLDAAKVFVCFAQFCGVAHRALAGCGHDNRRIASSAADNDS